MWTIINVLWTVINIVWSCLAAEESSSMPQRGRRGADKSLVMQAYRHRFPIVVGILVTWMTLLTYMVLSGPALTASSVPALNHAGEPVGEPNAGTVADILAMKHTGGPVAEKGHTTTEERQAAVKAAFAHAWGGYEKYAFGHDELKPDRREAVDPWGHTAATMIDALDTMYLMGFRDEFGRCIEWMKHNLDFNRDFNASFFETTIRVLGGLLSAYDLSREPFLLEKAKDIGDRLSNAFHSPTGIPYGLVNLKNGKSSNLKWTGRRAILAEIGSVQLEFKMLSYWTGDASYAERADRVLDLLGDFPFEDEVIGAIYPKGLYAVYIDVNKLPSEAAYDKNGFVTMGGLSDSFYEYLLKRWLLTNRTVSKWRGMYDQSILGMVQHLVTRSRPSGLVFVGERKNKQLKARMEHLACFVPGMLALGATTQKSQSTQERDMLMSLAEELAYTCWEMYRRSPTGLAPESVKLSTSPGESLDNEMVSDRHYYLLRPEAVESFMILWRITGKQQYRDWGWAVFEAIEQHCRTDVAYTTIKDVRNTPVESTNSLQTFFFAETLKYMYVLFSPPTVLPLDQYVYNTEAHPFRILPNERLRTDPQ